MKFYSAPTEPLKPQYDVEKTGAGTVVDFTGNAMKVHSALDAALQTTGLSVRDAKEASKEVARQTVEGVIRWHTRKLLITVPSEMSLETVKQALDTGVHHAGGQVIASQPDNYQGLAVLRLDIGVKDKIAGDDITIISDRVYLTKETAIINAKNTDSKVRAQMAIVIDDFGYSKEPINAFAAISRPLTFAVIPYQPFSNEAAARGLSSGHQIILHLPMEPISQAEQSEKLTIMVTMSDSEIQAMTRKAIHEVPGLIGVNNHQGSKATADKRVMRAVLSELKANNLFFLDSRTNSQSVGADTARQMGVRTENNQLFIDNSNEVSAVKEKLRTAQDIALKHGSVTVIGHARMSTAMAVSEMIPELEAKGIQLIFVSQMVN